MRADHILDTFVAGFHHPAAHCTGVTPLMYADEQGMRVNQAKRVCLGCPATDACLTYAIVNNEVFGVWGGKNTRERRAIRRQWIADGRLTVENNGNRKQRAWLQEVGA